MVGFVALLKSRIVSYWMAGSYQLDRIAVFLDITGSGSYQLDWIGWIGWIGLAGLDWIVSYCLDEDTSALVHWMVTARMGRMDWMGRWWDWGGTDGR